MIEIRELSLKLYGRLDSSLGILQAFPVSFGFFSLHKRFSDLQYE